MSIVRFVYSYPYEDALLRLGGIKLSEEHSKEAVKKSKTAQKVWNKYKKQILFILPTLLTRGTGKS